MAVNKQEIERRRLEFKKIKAEIDKVAKVQRFLVVVIRFSVTVLMVLLLFVFFMVLNYLIPISSKISQFMLYGMLGYFVISLLFYVIKPLFDKPDEEALALMIEKRYPQLLDRFICSVEMNKDEALANFSPELIKALWVDTDKVKKALKLDLRKSLAFTKGKQYIVIALIITVVAFAGSIVAPEFLLKSTSAITPVNKFVSSLLRGNNLDPEVLKQIKAVEKKISDKEKAIEELKNLLADQKKFNGDLKDAIQDRKAKEQDRALALSQKDPELANKPWLPGRDTNFKNPNLGGVSGIVTSNGKPMSGIYVGVKSTTDKKAQGYGAKTDDTGKWVVNGLSTDGSYQAWVLNDRYKSEPLSYFSGVVVEKGKIREGYNFTLKLKTLDTTPQCKTAGNKIQKPEDIFNDTDTYKDPATAVAEGGESAEEKMFPKMNFDKLDKKGDALASELKKNNILLPEDEKTKDLKKAEDQRPQTKEEKLQEMAKEMDKDQKDLADKMKDAAQKMEDLKADNKKDEKQKEEDRKEIMNQMVEAAKKLEELNKEEKDQKKKDINEEMAKELKAMAEQVKEEDKFKDEQQKLEDKTNFEDAKQKQQASEDELQKSDMEKALEKALEAEKKLEESLQKMLEEQQKMAGEKNAMDEEAKKAQDAAEDKEGENLDKLKEDLDEAAKDGTPDQKKLEEMLKELEDAAKKMEEEDKETGHRLLKELDEAKKEIEEEKKETDPNKKSKTHQDIGKRLETISGLLGELRNKAFLAKQHGIDEDPVANMTKDEVPSKYKKLVEKYRTSLSK